MLLCVCVVYSNQSCHTFERASSPISIVSHPMAQLENFTAYQLASLLKCDLPGNTSHSRQLWKLLLTRQSSVLEPALDRLANLVSVLNHDHGVLYWCITTALGLCSCTCSSPTVIVQARDYLFMVMTVGNTSRTKYAYYIILFIFHI